MSSVFVNPSRPSLAVALGLACSISAAFAASPRVIPGIGSPDAAYSSAEQRRAEPATQVAYSSGGGGLGGGFIEFLATGSSGQRYPSYAPTPTAAPQPAAYAPAEANVQREIDPSFQRTLVDYEGAERPGTVVVDSTDKFLYLVLGHGRALRYGIGVGRPGFTWTGVKTISRKAEWPDWTPPGEMLARRPDLPRHMVGGPANPLGARALYLGSSLYRIHGTNEPYTIGHNVSSGCIRMMNEDVSDLYQRVHVGTRVVVR